MAQQAQNMPSSDARPVQTLNTSGSGPVHRGMTQNTGSSGQIQIQSQTLTQNPLRGSGQLQSEMTGRSGKQTQRSGSNQQRATPAKSGSLPSLTPNGQAGKTPSQRLLQPPKSNIKFVKTRASTNALKQKMLAAGLTAISKHDKHGFMDASSSDGQVDMDDIHPEMVRRDKNIDIEPM